MDTLFATEPDFPQGFLYFPDFLTQAEEDELIGEILRLELHPLNFQGFIAKRKVASFGYDYSFDKRKLSKGKDIPPKFDGVIDNSLLF